MEQNYNRFRLEKRSKTHKTEELRSKQKILWRIQKKLK